MVGVDGIAKAVEALDKLADELLDVAEAQAMVDENQTIRVNVRDHELDELQRELAQTSIMQGMGAGGMGAGRAMASGGGAATADGGGRGGGAIGASDISRAMERFGEAFSADDLFRRGGGNDPMSMLGGDRTDFFDTSGMARAVASGDLDMDAFENPMENFGQLQGMGLTDLPTKKGGPLSRFQEWAANINATDLNNLFASLVPLLATFVGALPAAIAGVIALGAAAFAAVATLGALGGLAILGAGMGPDGFSMDRLTERIGEIRDIVVNTLAPLANKLEPLFGRATEGLQHFLDALVQQGDVLLMFRDDAMAFGQWLIDNIPPIVASFGRFADAASDTMGMIGDAFTNIDWAAAFAGLIIETLPALMQLGTAIADILPALIEMSVGFLRFIAGLLWAIDVFGKFLSILPISAELIGLFVAGLLTATTALALASTMTSIWAGTMLASAASALLMLGRQIFTVSFWILSRYVPSALAGVGATLALTAAVGILLGVLTFGLAPVLGAIGGQFAGMNKEIKEATKSLKRFKRTQAGAGAFGTGTGGGGGRYVDVTNEITVNGGSSKEAQNAAGRRAAYRQQQTTDSYFG